MATPESIASAFAEGMMRAMLAQPEAKAKEPKPKVVKTDDVERAVAKFLEAKLADAEPQQEELFPGVVDLGEDIYKRYREQVGAANDRADAMADPDEMPPGFFDANMPGAKQWVGP